MGEPTVKQELGREGGCRGRVREMKRGRERDGESCTTIESACPPSNLAVLHQIWLASIESDCTPSNPAALHRIWLASIKSDYTPLDLAALHRIWPASIKSGYTPPDPTGLLLATAFIAA
jgi:hypothetical protein